MITDSSDDMVFFCGNFDARLRVGIIYEDSGMALKAKLSLDLLGRRMNLETDPFDLRLWSYDLLADEQHRKSAAREAAEFDLVIFSVRNCAKLPDNIEDWLGEWLRYRVQRPCAMSLYVEEGTREVEKKALVDYLNTVARVGGIELVVPFQDGTKVTGDLISDPLFDAGPTRRSTPWDETAPSQDTYPGWRPTNKGFNNHH